MKLTPKQRAFVQEYLIDLNATQAALRAGYSERTVLVQGPRLLGNVRVAGALQAAFAERSARTEVTQDRVLEELARLAFSSIGDVLAWDSDGVVLKSSADLPQDVLPAVAEVTEVFREEGRHSVKVKLYDKRGALELLMRHLGMLRGERSPLDIPPGDSVKSIELRVVYDTDTLPEPIELPIVLDGALGD